MFNYFNPTQNKQLIAKKRVEVVSATFTRDSSLQGNTVIRKVFLKTVHGRTAL